MLGNYMVGATPTVPAAPSPAPAPAPHPTITAAAGMAAQQGLPQFVAAQIVVSAPTPQATMGHHAVTGTPVPPTNQSTVAPTTITAPPILGHHVVSAAPAVPAFPMLGNHAVTAAPVPTPAQPAPAPVAPVIAAGPSVYVIPTIVSQALTHFQAHKLTNL